MYLFSGFYLGTSRANRGFFMGNLHLRWRNGQLWHDTCCTNIYQSSVYTWVFTTMEYIYWVQATNFFSHSHCVYLNAISNSVILDSKHTLLHNNTRFAGRKWRVWPVIMIFSSREILLSHLNSSKLSGNWSYIFLF